MPPHSTGGTWDAGAWPRYFIAGSLPWVAVAVGAIGEDALIAVNELTDNYMQVFDCMIAAGGNVFLDSGVFNLANEHARRHGLSMDEALSLPPNQVDGFDKLFDRYVMIARRYGDRLWGYVEIDQGGLENKRKTRARLEAMGLAPIPVYHPINDGWDYFDELAEQYDRICFGNVVMAPPEQRKRLVATAWERRRKYPNLWIHLLGLTPYAISVAFPANSCDSSTWLSPMRWGQLHAWGATQDLWPTGTDLIYNREADSHAPDGAHKGCLVAGYDAFMLSRCMRRIVDDQRAILGCTP